MLSLWSDAIRRCRRCSRARTSSDVVVLGSSYSPRDGSRSRRPRRDGARAHRRGRALDAAASEHASADSVRRQREARRFRPRMATRSSHARSVLRTALLVLLDESLDTGDEAVAVANLLGDLAVHSRDVGVSHAARDAAHGARRRPPDPRADAAAHGGSCEIDWARVAAERRRAAQNRGGRARVPWALALAMGWIERRCFVNTGPHEREHMTRVLVTGATGFVGRHLCTTLASTATPFAPQCATPRGSSRVRASGRRRDRLAHRLGRSARRCRRGRAPCRTGCTSCAADKSLDSFVRIERSRYAALGSGSGASKVRRFVYLSTRKGERREDRRAIVHRLG